MTLCVRAGALRHSLCRSEMPSSASGSVPRWAPGPRGTGV